MLSIMRYLLERASLSLSVLVAIVTAMGPATPALATSCPYAAHHTAMSPPPFSGWTAHHGNYGTTPYADAYSTGSHGVTLTQCQGWNCPQLSANFVSSGWAQRLGDAGFSIVQSDFFKGTQYSGLVACRAAI